MNSGNPVEAAQAAAKEDAEHFAPILMSFAHGFALGALTKGASLFDAPDYLRNFEVLLQQQPEMLQQLLEPQLEQALQLFLAARESSGSEDSAYRASYREAYTRTFREELPRALSRVLVAQLEA